MALPEPFGVAELCRALSEERRRPLHLCAIPGPALPSRPCGLWVATAEGDWIFVERGTSPLHRQHIVLHELAHMICGHAAVELPAGDAVTRLLPDLSPTMVRSVLGRTSYSSADEREAELLASLILARAQPAGKPVMDIMNISAADMEIVRRVGSAFGLGP